MNKVFQIIDKLNDSNFQDINNPRSKNITKIQKGFEVLSENLWSMFTMKYSKEELSNMSQTEKHETYGCSVVDYAWTKEVEDAFKSHPKHDKFIKMNEKTYGFWALNVVPMTVDSVNDVVVSENG